MNKSLGITFLLAALATFSISAAGFSPIDISGSVLWLDAADLSTLTTNGGGAVSAWSDKSADGAGTMANAANQPLSGAVSCNGHNVLLFDGNQWLAGNAVLAEGDDDYTYIAVWRTHKTTGAQVVFEQGSGKNQRASLLLNKGSYGFYGESNDRNLVPFSANEWRLTLMEVDNNLVNNITIVNNETAYAGATSNPSALDIGTQGSRVAAKVSNNGERFLGEIAEIIVYDRILTEAERAEVRSYLSAKWALGFTFEVYDTVIDFEDGIPVGWTPTGLFTNQPTSSTRATFNKNFSFLIDTYYKYVGGTNAYVGNGPTGELTGNAFVMLSNTVKARIGGGNNGARIQFQLQRQKPDLSWEVVRRSTGRDANLMRELVWNTENLVGETVRFNVLDNDGGTWGIISLDYIRLLDKPPVRDLVTDFNGLQLPDGLHPQCQLYGAEMGVTGSGAAYIDFKDTVTKFDAWTTTDNAAKILVNTVDNEIFAMQTHITSRSLTNYSSQAGLILDLEQPTPLNEYSYNPVMFGVYTENKVRIEGPGVGLDATDDLANTITNIHLRIEGQNDHFTFKYSMDGTNWSTLASQEIPDAVLMQAGMFSKRWSEGELRTQRVEFDSFSYQSIAKILGTVILVQ